MLPFNFSFPHQTIFPRPADPQWILRNEKKRIERHETKRLNSDPPLVRPPRQSLLHPMRKKLKFAKLTPRTAAAAAGAAPAAENTSTA